MRNDCFGGSDQIRSLPSLLKSCRLTKTSELLETYRSAAEALHDALITLGSRIHTGNRGEYERLSKLVEKCEADLAQAQREFKRKPEDLKRSG